MALPRLRHWCGPSRASPAGIGRRLRTRTAAAIRASFPTPGIVEQGKVEALPARKS